MEILAKESEWLHTDSDRLAEFLETGTGKRLIPTLVQSMPPLLAGGEINAILIRSGEVRAFQSMVESLLMLAHPAPKSGSPVVDYPELEDDAAWADGQKINPDGKPEVPKTQ